MAVAVEEEIAPQPARVGPASLTVRLRNADGQPLSGARIRIETDMSHPGMAPGFSEAQEGEPGRYVARLAFTMAGDWVVLLHLTLPGGRKLERQIEVRNVRAL